jgi:hypothetical protein
MDGGEETGARVRQIAGDVLGLADLRPAQMEAAAALAVGRDCLAVLPSGVGTINGDRVSCWRLKPTGAPSCSTTTDTGNWPRRWSPASTCLRPHDKRC